MPAKTTAPAAAPSPTLAELEARRDELAAERDELTERRNAIDATHNAALARRSHLGGAVFRGRADASEVDAADEAVARAAQEATDAGYALDAVVADLAEAEQAVEQARLLDLRKTREEQATTETGGLHRLQRAFGDAEGALAVVDAARAAKAEANAALRAGYGDQVESIERKYAEACKAASATRDRDWDQAKLAGATVRSQDREERPTTTVWVLNPEMQLEARGHVTREYERAMATPTADRSRELAALGIALDAGAGDDALHLALGEYRAMLGRLAPQVAELRAALREAIGMVDLSRFTDDRLHTEQARADALREVLASI